jgi:large subunit ribosomal protein L21
MTQSTTTSSIQVMSMPQTLREMSSNVVYAIVKAGGRQEKVSVGDVVVVDRLSGDAGESIELPALLLVDGEKVTTKAADLAKVKVTAEIVRDEKGPKITILKFKNKTGYRKRQGHRQQLTRLKVTGIK